MLMIAHNAVTTIIIDPMVSPISANALGRDSHPAPMIDAHQEIVPPVIRDDKGLAWGLTLVCGWGWRLVLVI